MPQPHNHATEDFARLYNEGLIIDLFAGGGGASVALEQALGRPVSIALNHDRHAVTLHGINHPHTRHVCQDIETAVTLEITRGKPVFAIWASPSCTQHSRAKAARPADSQLREMGWKVIEWVRDTRPVLCFLENVAEFALWGPLNSDGRPDKGRLGETWSAFLQAFKDLGYNVEFQVLNAADYGAPTSRTRLFLVARRDEHEIAWPAKTHGPRNASPYEMAADYIDWEQSAPSIFDRKKPLAEATIERIVKGMKRFIFDEPNPFIVPGLPTVGNGERKCDAVAAFLTQNNLGRIGHDMRKPISTITATGSQQGLVLAYMDKARRHGVGTSMREPLHTICAQGDHFAEVRIKAFGVKYYTEGGQLQDLRAPLGTITTKDRFAIVLVKGEPHIITDIGYRFLTAAELWKLQGFSDDYKIDLVANGKPLGATYQKRMVGNSVSPPAGHAVIAANVAVYERPPLQMAA